MLTSRDKTLLDMPLIAEQLPVTLNNGAQWQTLLLRCEECNSAFTKSDVAGLLTVYQGRMIVVEAVGVCEDCQLITRFNLRLHDDFTFSAPGQGAWQRKPLSPPTSSRFPFVNRRSFLPMKHLLKKWIVALKR